MLTAVLEKLRVSYKTYKKAGEKGLFDRSTFRALMSKINAVGGYVLLDALSPYQLNGLLTELVGIGQGVKEQAKSTKSKTLIEAISSILHSK